MINISRFIILLLLLCTFSCKKKEELIPVLNRGEVINVVSIGNVSKNVISGFVGLLYPQYKDSIDFKYDVKLIRYEYVTKGLDGENTTTSGLLALPIGKNTNIPMISFQHGTLLQKSQAPSAILKINWEEKTIQDNLGTGFEIGAIFACEGTAIVITDYLGMGKGDGIHPYLHAESEANTVVDIIRSARKLAKLEKYSINNQVFLMGHSQGGHATMAAHRMIEKDYASEINIVASAPMAGPYDPAGDQFDFVMQEDPYASPGYLPYVIYGMNEAYDIYPDPSILINDEYKALIKNTFRDPIDITLVELEELLPSSKIPSDILNESDKTEILNDKNHPLRVALQDNATIDWTPKAPMKMYHGKNDVHVIYANALKAQEAFKQRGVDVPIIDLDENGGDHKTILLPSLIDAVQWFKTMY